MNENDHIETQEAQSKIKRELKLKQLQIKSLLAVTQAINDNVSEDALFTMYKTFISWDMRLSKMVLYVKRGEQWTVGTTMNIDYNIAKPEVIQSLLSYKRLQTLSGHDDDPILREFSVVIPVFHKESPLSYALFGGVDEYSDFLNRIQFVQTITNIIMVAVENKRLFNERLKQERLHQSLTLAGEVQQMFIPDSFPVEKKFELNGIYKPHFSVGGDYLDYFILNDDEFLFCIADVSGKGVGAAMLMANFHAVLRSMVLRFTHIEKLVLDLNESIYAITKSDKFITFFIGHVDTNARTLTYINAGHCRPLMAYRDQVRLLDKGCSILGIQPKIKKLEFEQVEYKPGTFILNYTDGLTELQNEEDDFFDEDHLKMFGYTVRAKTAASFNAQLRKRLDTFRGLVEYADDIAVLTCLLK